MPARRRGAAARLQDLLQTLRRHGPATAQELAGLLNTLPDAVQDGLAELKAQGAPIKGSAKAGYTLKPGPVLPPLVFSGTEVDMLLLGLRLVLEQDGDDEDSPVHALLQRISDALPDDDGPGRDTDAVLDELSASSASLHLPTLRQALRAEQKVKLRYADKKGAGTERVVWPVALGFFEGYEMLAAWCELRRDFRHFRLDRIAAAQATGERLPKRRRLLEAQWRAQAGQDGMA